MFTLTFWKATAERAVKTAAEVVLAVYFVGDVALNALEADWLNMGGIALGGAVGSVLFSLASGARDGNPSATNAEIAVDKGRHEA
jgi:hypothetical protein